MPILCCWFLPKKLIDLFKGGKTECDKYSSSKNCGDIDDDDSSDFLKI